MLRLLPPPPVFSSAATHHGRLMEISREIKGLGSPASAAAKAESLLTESCGPIYRAQGSVWR